MPTSGKREIRIQLPALHAAQEQVRVGMRRFTVICCGRRWGKSTFMQTMACTRAVERGRVGFWSPTYKDLGDAWIEMKDILHEVIVQKNEQFHQIRLMGGGLIDMWSGDDPDAGRGRKYHRAVIDEAAKIPKLEQLWTGTIRPTLTDYRGDVLFGSTPKGLNYFHTLFSRADDDPDWASFQMPTVTNTKIPGIAEEVEAARRDMPQAIFEQEYEAQFLSDGASVFRRVTENATGAAPAPYPGTFVMGVDWGRVNDFTVLTVMDAATCRVVEVQRFNQIDWHVQRSRLAALFQRWRCTGVLAEQNSIGDVNIEELRRMGIPVMPFTMGELTKSILVEELTNGLEYGKLTLVAPTEGEPQYAAMIHELQAFAMEPLASGRLRYAAPPGQHDDCVISLALAYRAATADAGMEASLKTLPTYTVA